MFPRNARHRRRGVDQLQADQHQDRSSAGPGQTPREAQAADDDEDDHYYDECDPGSDYYHDDDDRDDDGGDKSDDDGHGNGHGGGKDRGDGDSVDVTTVPSINSGTQQGTNEPGRILWREMVQ